MKPKVIVITGRTLSGKKGIRYEHTLKIGTLVKVSDGREGEIIGKGMAGMPEVEFEDGSTCLYTPSDLEIIGENDKNQTPPPKA
jgi:hypothetical protein